MNELFHLHSLVRTKHCQSMFVIIKSARIHGMKKYIIIQNKGHVTSYNYNLISEINSHLDFTSLYKSA